jgi:hypothetical protein
VKRIWFLIFVAGCTPDLGAPASLINSTRVLALRGNPAEAAPSKMVSWDSLVASKGGTVMMPGLMWSFCLDPKPLSDNNAVSVACFGDSMLAGGPAPTLSAALPKTGCGIFGPDPPPQMPGKPPLRPRDPDVTGGYYQPLVVDLPMAGDNNADVLGVDLERISCDLANAPSDVVTQFAKTYMPNQNPSLAAVVGSVGGAGMQPLVPEGMTAMGGMLATVSPGAVVTFEAQFADGSAEDFPVFNTVTSVLDTHHESLRVSWFATAGSFDHDRTGVGETDTATVTDDNWTAPTATGMVTIWVVLRDSRGGVDWKSYTLGVQ